MDSGAAFLRNMWYLYKLYCATPPIDKSGGSAILFPSMLRGASAEEFKDLLEEKKSVIPIERN